MNEAGDKMLKRVQGFCARNGLELGSHVYHKGLFLVSKEIDRDTRKWMVARWDANNTKVSFVEGAESPLQTGAKTMLQRVLADHGISPASQPVYKLKDVPTFPRWGVL